MIIDQTKLGYEIQTATATIFFGGKESQISDLRIAYPNFDFVRLKQIHSDAVVESANASQDLLIHGDAHFSKTRNLALCVTTADCIPVFLHHEESGLIAGIHAGWRGVANQIVRKTLEQFARQGISCKEILVVIGPHIQKPNFEVGRDVRDQILQSIHHIASGDHSLFFENVSADKSLVDLNQVLKTQLQNVGVHHENLFDLHIDTFTHPFFHSHRRDREMAGRQLSFIARH